MNRDSLRELLMRHEGLSLKPYKDTVGLTTIGYGRNLDGVGISEDEAIMLLDNDIAKVVAYCRDAYPWFNTLCNVRQNVIASLVFNLGAAGVAKFTKMLEAMTRADYMTAASEMQSSKWAAQVGKRAVELAEMMRTGDTLH